ncbi:hypothetical protein J2750_002228 [Methanococcoides alaskense]|uniref:Uncharacterized protein n=1 Tax=Methanococcoides alaskense TaxID=325778 RepID=A0AA90U138_9EURY|nr:hypothetical protein [Methanococcoides alaskense]MDA0524296.1 hypothetical protein [Methanococcoides alaskense]MDR6223752.1 hypothetical protein [Methanococcoides alaskense]
MTNIMMPADRFIFLLLVTRNLMSLLLFVVDIAEKTSNGKLNPIPKAMKFRKFSRKPVLVRDLANRAAMNAGLHGTTMAPKKNPYKKAVMIGLLLFEMLVLGKNLPISKSSINNILMMNSMPNAIGEIIPMTFVSETCNIVVNNIPRSAIKRITPALIISPKMIGSFSFFSFPDIWLERYARNAGYNGKTQTAVSGVSNPSVKEINISVIKGRIVLISIPPLAPL